MPIINGQGRVAVRVTGGAPAPSSSYLLDTYGGAAAAYSLRKLSSTYSGSAIRVRRSSDNTEMNIGFDGSGNLDTTALTSFVGAGNGFVTTWFDQSGNNKNAVQTTAANQPQIVSSGVVETMSSKPAVNMLTLPPMLVSSTTYKNVISVAKADTLNVINYVLGDSGNGLFYHGYYGGVTGVGGFDGSNIRSLTGGDTNRHLGWFQMKSSNLYVSKDGSSESNLGSFATSLNLTELGGRSASPVIYLQGKIQEVILYNNDNTSNKSAIESNINTYYSIYSPMDSDAQAFVSAAGITDSTQASAVNTLVTSLKSAGIWTKMKAIYPFVGGTASSHKFNLKDPRDLDAAYRLVFNGGWTHSSTGALPNGTTGYANTKLAPSSALSLNSASFGFYGYKSTPENVYQIGTEGGFGVGGSSLSVAYFDNFNPNPRFVSSLNGGSAPNGVNTTISGMYMVSRASANSIVAVKNTTTLTTGTSAAAGLSSQPLFIGSYNSQGWPSGYSNTDFRMAYVSDGLTTSEMSTLYTAVQAFQTTLGRQVA